jgi:Tfp pilus assembly protein PilF
VLAQHGRINDSATLYRRVLQQRPEWSDVLVDFGELLRTSGQRDEALALFDRALALNPSSIPAHNGRGLALHDLGRLDEAIETYRRSIALDPDKAPVLNNLGFALESRNQLDEAKQVLERALEVQPDQIDAISNLANTLRDLGRWDDALAMYRRGLQIQPENARLRFNRALLLLLLGDFTQGWDEYEWRWLLFKQHKRTFAQPRWLDADPKGKRILVYAEQGLGDTIQFARYLPMLVERGATVIFECHAELHPLLRDFPGVSQCVPRGQALPDFDYHVALLSLPLSFATTAQTIPTPREGGYLKADAAKTQAWKQRLAGDGARLRVGITWGGDPTNKMESTRSCALSTYAPLAGLEGVVFYSLQKGPSAAQAKNPPPGMTLVEYSDEFRDFSDTAALAANLDLVISVDTAVAHLAGALGLPAWTLLPFNPDFRWMRNRTDTPWYPTMRLFRPPKPLDWQAVLAQVEAGLRTMLHERST